MKKTLFTAALAFVLSLGGFVLSAQDQDPVRLAFSNDSMKLVVASKVDSDLTNGLSLLSGSTVTANFENKTSPGKFGYKLNDGTFSSLAEKINEIKVDNATKTATIPLGEFKDGDTYQFGFEDGDQFSPVGPTLEVASDPLFYGEFSSEGFYQLDFSKDPFNGMIEIYVMGEPLPASTVTMLVALAAAGAFLLYRNRKTRARVSAQA